MNKCGFFRWVYDIKLKFDLHHLSRINNQDTFHPYISYGKWEWGPS